jgi:hypothetical protein
MGDDRHRQLLTNVEPGTWACQCGQMNLREDYVCCACGGDREEHWEGNDREAVLREEQWDTD